MQYDDGKINPKHIVASALFVVGLFATSICVQASKEAKAVSTIVPAAKIASVVDYGTSAIEKQFDSSVEVDEGTDLVVEDTDLVVEEEPAVQIYSLDIIQEKCDKTGIHCETPEVNTGLHFNPEDVSQPSNMTLEQLKSFTVKYCPEWVGLEEYILTLDSEVNLIFLLSVARMETWAGIRTVGDYNCFNIRYNSGAYCDYTSYTESIDHFVQLITEEYLNPEGRWYEGVSIHAIGLHYAQERWAPGITNLCYEIYEYML